MKKNLMTISAAFFVTAAVLLSGCGSQDDVLRIEETSAYSGTESTETESTGESLAIDAAAFTSGISDLSVFSGAKIKVIASFITVDVNVVKKAVMDASEVKIDKEGEYNIHYYLVMDREAVKSALTSDSYAADFIQIEAENGTRPNPEDSELVEEIIRRVHVVLQPEESTEEVTEESSESPEESEMETEEEVPEQPVEPEQNNSTGQTPVPQPTQPPAPTPVPTPQPQPSAPQPQPSAPQPVPTPVPQPTQPPAPTQPSHTHNWVEQTTTIHHDAETETIHHDAETEIVHHEAVGGYEYDTIYIMHCSGCGAVIEDGNMEAHLLVSESCSGEYELETLTENEHWVEYEPAYDEVIEISPAWDEIIVIKESYNETVVTGYRCSCGETR